MTQVIQMTWHEPREHASALCAFGLGAAMLLLGSSAFAQPTAATTTAIPLGADAEADRLREAGKAASKAGQFEKAEEFYRRAWRLRQGWEIAANLGLTEFRLGRNRDAAEHLTYFLREAPANRVGEADRKATQETIDKALTKVGALRITVSPAGAEVLVNGQVVGTAPLLGAVFIEPGPVVVEARLMGYAGAKASRMAVAAKEDNLSLSLEKAIVTPRPAITRKLAMPDSNKRVAGVAIGGVGVAILGVGAVTGILSLVNHANAVMRCPRYIDCSPDAKGAASSGKALSIVSTVAFGTGLAGVGIGTYLVLSSGATRGKTSVELTMLPGGGAVTAMF